MGRRSFAGSCPDEEWAYAEKHIFFGETYQSDLHPVIEELAPDVLMTDIALRYAILEGLRVDLPLVLLHHILYGGTVDYPESTSPYYPALIDSATDRE